MVIKFDPLTSLIAIGVASYVAIVVDYVARDDFGCSNGQIRIVALAAAIFIAAALTLDRLGRRPG